MKKQQSSHDTPWWKGTLSLVSQVLSTEIRSVVLSTRNQIRNFIQIATVRFFLLLSGFLGLIFILMGLSRLLAEVFHSPGIADVLLGSTLLSLSLIFFFILRREGKGY